MLEELVQNFWIGQVDDKYYSLLMPVNFKDVNKLKELVSQNENIYLINKMADTKVELDKLTKIVVLFIVIALVVITVIFKFFYNSKNLLKILQTVVLTLISTFAIMSILNIPVGFFTITGIILVFGLSIDYIVYLIENSQSENLLAIIISYLSSAISFGLLAFSSFMPVKTFGLTVFIGLTVALCLTLLSKENNAK